MKCREAQELIITDHLDAELGQAKQQRIERHLAQCPVCRQYAAEVREKTRALFKSEKEIPPPEWLWYRIKDAVIADRRIEAQGFFARVRAAASVGWRLPRTAFATSAVAALILVAAVFVKLTFEKHSALSAYLHDEMEFVTTLSSEAKSEQTDLFETNIEQGFL